MNTVGTRALVEKLCISQVVFNNLRAKHRDKIQPTNPGARLLQWDLELIPIIEDLLRNRRKYGAARLNNCSSRGWKRQVMA